MNEEQNYVEICDEDGVTTKCEIYDVVDFEDKTYALLMPLDDDDEAELITEFYTLNKKVEKIGEKSGERNIETITA